VIPWPAKVTCTLNAAFGDKQGLEDQHALSGASLFVPCNSVNEHQSGSIGKGDAAPCVAVAMRESGQGYWMEDDIAGTLRAEGEDRPSRPSHVIGIPPAMQVRRLTPRECERLQGFPDDWTDIPYRGKQAPDGPRYKALGNSMAVPVMRWIGERIACVENMLNAA